MVYALFMLMFGQTLIGIHLGLLLINVINVLLVGLLARRLFNPRAALAAAASYALLSLSQSVLGVFAHATHFVVLFTLAGLLLLLRHLDSGRVATLCSAGICLGLAIAMKQHAILFAGFAALYYGWQVKHQTTSAGQHSLVKWGVLLLSMAVPLLLLAAWLALAGVFPEFWFWTIRYASDYVSSVTFGDGLSRFAGKFMSIVRPQWPFWLLAAAGAGVALLRPRICRDRLLLFGLLGASFLAICPGFYFREHYFVMLLPPVALLIGAAVAGVESCLNQCRQAWLSSVVPCLVLLLAAGYGVQRERSYLLQLTPHQISRAIYGRNPFPESLVVAEYLKERTSPADRIAVLGSEPQIFFYANRLSATGHIYMYGLMEKHRDAEMMQRQMIAEVEASRPEYVMMVNVPTSWLIRPDSTRLVLAWAEGFLAEYYDPAGIVAIAPDRTAYLLDTNDQFQAFPDLQLFRRKH
jgi:hypothetical protein